MAVLVVDSKAVGQRVRMLRKAALLSGRGFATALGSSDTGLASRLEHGVGLNHRWIRRVADSLAGRGLLKKTTPEELLAFLEGRRDELELVLDGNHSYMSYLRDARSAPPRSCRSTPMFASSSL